MEEYHWPLRNGITRTRGFEKKRLAQFAVNCGLKCGHGCTYCSTGAVLRRHKAFKELGLSPFENGYAIVDPDTPVRVAHDAASKRERGLVELCTFVDAWSPEAQQYDLGRRCLEAILSEPGWTVRILTKNVAVAKDFDVIDKYKSRVLFGVSITAVPDKNRTMAVVEPYASLNSERISVLREAHSRGFRTYAMFCPLLPEISDWSWQIDELISIAADCEAEETFVEPVNLRGRALILTNDALRNSGYPSEAVVVASIRDKEYWSRYATQLILNVQRSVRKLYDISRLRFLLYPSRLTSADIVGIKKDDVGVIWLDNK
jgi:DNA repair photolyase